MIDLFTEINHTLITLLRRLGFLLFKWRSIDLTHFEICISLGIDRLNPTI